MAFTGLFRDVFNLPTASRSVCSLVERSKTSFGGCLPRVTRRMTNPRSGWDCISCRMLRKRNVRWGESASWTFGHWEWKENSKVIVFHIIDPFYRRALRLWPFGWTDFSAFNMTWPLRHWSFSIFILIWHSICVFWHYYSVMKMLILFNARWQNRFWDLVWNCRLTLALLQYTELWAFIETVNQNFTCFIIFPFLERQN